MCTSGFQKTASLEFPEILSQHDDIRSSVNRLMHVLHVRHKREGGS